MEPTQRNPSPDTQRLALKLQNYLVISQLIIEKIRKMMQVGHSIGIEKLLIDILPELKRGFRASLAFIVDSKKQTIDSKNGDQELFYSILSSHIFGIAFKKKEAEFFSTEDIQSENIQIQKDIKKLKRLDIHSVLLAPLMMEKGTHWIVLAQKKSDPVLSQESEWLFLGEDRRFLEIITKTIEFGLKSGIKKEILSHMYASFVNAKYSGDWKLIKESSRNLLKELVPGEDQWLETLGAFLESSRCTFLINYTSAKESRPEDEKHPNGEFPWTLFSIEKDSLAWELEGISEAHSKVPLRSILLSPLCGEIVRILLSKKFYLRMNPEEEEMSEDEENFIKQFFETPLGLIK